MARLLAFVAALLSIGVPVTASADCGEPCSYELCRTQSSYGDRWALVEARVHQNGDSHQPPACEVTAIHGGPLASAITIGQELTCGPTDTERVLLVVVESTLGDPSTIWAETQLRIDEDEQVSCYWGSSGIVRLNAAVQVALSDDCESEAEAAGFDEGGECCDTCSAGGSGAGLLALGLVGFGLRRRNPRRKSSGHV